MENKPKVYNYIKDINKDVLDSIRDYVQDYDFTWLIQYLTENFTPEELYGEDYMQEWYEKNGYYPAS